MLPQASQCVEVTSEHTGWVGSIEAEQIGIAAMMLGAGRETKDSVIDLSAGVVLRKKVGDQVSAGDILFEVHVNPTYANRLDDVIGIVKSAFQITATPQLFTCSKNCC